MTPTPTPTGLAGDLEQLAHQIGVAATLTITRRRTHDWTGVVFRDDDTTTSRVVYVTQSATTLHDVVRLLKQDPLTNLR